ncbi:MAG: MBL fold metallo-hydrolase [Solobacterium sp.]|nr:MBL fold metallo-hydrolase [Solobacterium sp.]
MNYSTSINTVKQVSDDLYIITEAESIHCYLLIGSEKALLIDAGWGYEDIHPILRKITDKPVMLVITHGDPDHGLGAANFSDFWIHPLDYGKLLRNDTYDERKSMLDYRLKKLPSLASFINEEEYCNSRLHATAHFLRHGEIINLGNKHVECILTPGHSYGHLMFLEKEQGRLFAGDQLMDEHNIWHFSSSDEQAPFQITLNSLKKLKARINEINAIYPAHEKTPIEKRCLDELIECFEHELSSSYENDRPFHSPHGNAWQHLYKSVNLIYSDERLEEFLGHPVKHKQSL